MTLTPPRHTHTHTHTPRPFLSDNPLCFNGQMELMLKATQASKSAGAWFFELMCRVMSSVSAAGVEELSADDSLGSSVYKAPASAVVQLSLLQGTKTTLNISGVTFPLNSLCFPFVCLPLHLPPPPSCLPFSLPLHLSVRPSPPAPLLGVGG